MEHKSRRQRRLKFCSGGNLRGFQRKLNFVRFRAQYKRVYFILLWPFFRERRLLVRAVYERSLKNLCYSAMLCGQWSRVESLVARVAESRGGWGIYPPIIGLWSASERWMMFRPFLVFTWLRGQIPFGFRWGPFLFCCLHLIYLREKNRGRASSPQC